MANRRKRIKSRVFSIGKQLFPVAKALAAPISFLEQVSAKDRQQLGSAFTTAPTTQKLKILANIVTGRVTGINFFSNEYQAPQTINPAGILNKWTNGGGLMLVYGFLGSKVNQALKMNVAPATSKFQQIGKQLIIGGAVGGFFDDPAITSQGRTQQGTRNLSPPELLTVPNSFSFHNRGGSGSDSNASGLE